MSPVSMLARRTSASGRSKAWAMASSTRLSFDPIRRSPVMIFTMYFTSPALPRRNTLASSSAFCDAPRAAARSSKSRATSDSAKSRSTFVPRRSSAAMSPRSPMLSVCGSEVVVRLADGVSDDTEQICSADPERAFVVRREGVTRKKPGGDHCLRDAERFQKFADQTQLLKLFGGGADSIRDLYKAAHNAPWRSRLAYGFDHAAAGLTVCGIPARL